ncbi:hypothetical protein Y1Q_0004157 [Alligator mississippiensis]|uniref:Uncharacterized protein n=1 Tax=Alligator mississippiensis TaxID=8496 RepID=A0A151PI77_ALLMI|nr:hypothetical protein Y1Q_0004157 [Alligator mississippiensis]
MDNHQAVFYRLVVWLQFLHFILVSGHNFSICKHGEIKDKYMFILMPDLDTYPGKKDQDYHDCEVGNENLLRCIHNVTRRCICTQYKHIWQDTRALLNENCKSYDPLQDTGCLKPVARKRRASGSCNKELAELRSLWRSYMNLEDTVP